MAVTSTPTLRSTRRRRRLYGAGMRRSHRQRLADRSTRRGGGGGTWGSPLWWMEWRPRAAAARGRRRVGVSGKEKPKSAGIQGLVCNYQLSRGFRRDVALGFSWG